MKKPLYLIIITLLFACKKYPIENSPAYKSAGGKGTGSSSNSGSSGSQVLLINENIASVSVNGNDTQNIIYTYTGSALNGIADESGLSPLIYDKNGLLISQGAAKADMDYYTFTYNANAELTDAVIMSYSADGKLAKTLYYKYTLANGRVTGLDSYDNTKTLVYKYTYQYDTNGNMVTSTQYDPSGRLISETDYTYGTHHSPYANSPYKYLFDPANETYFTGKNEVLTAKTVSQQDTQTVNYSYTYNKDYPVTGKFIYNYSFDPKSTTTVTEAYTYNNL